MNGVMIKGEMYPADTLALQAALNYIRELEAKLANVRRIANAEPRDKAIAEAAA